MKNLYLLFVAVFIVTGTTLAADNYVLDIDGASVDLSLGSQKEVTLKDGKKITVKLSQKDIVTYESEMFEFKHQNAHSPNKTQLGSGISQTLMTTPHGTAILIQEYTEANPTPYVDVMLQELTKEETSYGYQYAEEPITKTLADGKILKGKQATTTYKDTKWIRSVLSIGQKDSGVLVITVIEKENLKQESPILDAFWSTLALKVK
jgi:hypothetical protein